VNEVLLWILDLVRSVDPVARALLAGGGIFLETSLLVGLIVPGDTIVLVAATAVETPVQYVALLVAVIVGALGGESVGFAIGRFFGPKIRDSRLGSRIGVRN
jgi:membrane-associated protein